LNSLERQLSLVACLFHHRFGRTLAEIQRDLPAYGAGESGRKKFQRDRKLLEELGIPIRMRIQEGDDEDGNLSYRYQIDRREVFARRIEFSEDEHRALTLLSDRLRRAEDFPLREFARSAWEKLRSGTDSAKDAAERRLFQAADSLRGGPDPAEAKWLDLAGEAIFRNRKLRLDYRTLGTGKENRRVIHPHGLVFRRGRWYLAAWCELRDSFRVFRLSRIIDAELTGESFTPNPEFRLAEQAGDAAWEFGFGEGPTAEVRFDTEVSRLAARRLKGKAELSESESGLRAEIPVGIEEAFLFWLLGWGRHAHLLEPPEMKRRLALWLGKALTRYEEGA